MWEDEVLHDSSVARWDWVWADWVHACCLQPTPELGCGIYGAAEFLGLMGCGGPGYGVVLSMAKKQEELSVCLSTKLRQRSRESPERNEIITEVSIHLVWAVFPQFSCSLSFNWNYFCYSKSKVFSTAVKSYYRLLYLFQLNTAILSVYCRVSEYQYFHCLDAFKINSFEIWPWGLNGLRSSFSWQCLFPYLPVHHSVEGMTLFHLNVIFNLRDRQSAFYVTEALRSR